MAKSLVILSVLIQLLIRKCDARSPLNTEEILDSSSSSGAIDATRSHLLLRHRRQHSRPFHRQLGADECTTFSTCSELSAALMDASALGMSLKVCASATPISCRTTKNSGPSSIVLASAASPRTAVLECVSNNLGDEDGGRCVLDLSPGDGLDPNSAAYSAIFLRFAGNKLEIRGFELRGVRGDSRVAYVQRGAELTFLECVFTDNQHIHGNTPVIVYDYGTPSSATVIENSYFSDNVGELLDFQSGTGVVIGNIFYNNRAVADQKTNFITNRLVTGTQFILENNRFIANDSTGARTFFWLVATEDPTKTMVTLDLLSNVNGNCASDNFITGQYPSLQISECHNGIYTKGKWTEGCACTNFDPCPSQGDGGNPPLPCDAFLPTSCSNPTDPITSSPSQTPSSSPTGIVIHAQPTSELSSQDECTPQDDFSTCGNNPLEYFIDSNQGNDDNDGSTIEAPIKSISRAIEIANINPSSAIIFNLSGGYYGEFGLGPWTNPFAQRTSSESWIQFIASTSPDGNNPVIFNHVKINFAGTTECRVLLRGVRIVGTAPGSSNDNNAIDIKTSSHVRIHECVINPENLDVWTVYSKMPQGLLTRRASNIIMSSSEIYGGRYGIVLGGIGRYIQIIDCNIHHQFGDAIRVVSVENVLIKGNHIHHVADYQNTGEHIDGIQFFPSGPSGQYYYPQSHNVQIMDNLITDMVGQMIFIQANYIDKIGYMENITVANNILGPKTVVDASAPVQVQGVKNYLFQRNSIIGKVIIRLSSSGILFGNIIGHLSVSEHASVLQGSNYNIIGMLQVTANNGGVKVGISSIIATTTYADVDALDFAPTTRDACSGGPDGLHAGAVACRSCEWDTAVTGYGPIANFAIHPLRLGPTEQEVTLISSSSAICDGEADFDTGLWVVSGVEKTFTSSSLEDSQTLCLSTHGIYSITFTLTDTNGQHSSLTKQVIKEAPAIEGLVAQYPLSSSTLSDISSNKHDDATSPVPSNSTITIDNNCDLNSFLTLGYDDHVVLPKSVGGAINLKRGLTASLWAKPDTPGVQLLYKHVSLGIWIEDSTTVNFAVGTNANETHPAYFNEKAATASNADIFDGQWHHYAVTFNGMDTLGYIDGTLQASATVPSSTYATGYVRDGNWDLTLGLRPWKDRNYVGNIKDFRLFDRELTAHEIMGLASDMGGCDNIFCVDSIL